MPEDQKPVSLEEFIGGSKTPVTPLPSNDQNPVMSLRDFINSPEVRSMSEELPSNIDAPTQNFINPHDERFSDLREEGGDFLTDAQSQLSAFDETADPWALQKLMEVGNALSGFTGELLNWSTMKFESLEPVIENAFSDKNLLNSGNVGAVALKRLLASKDIIDYDYENKPWKSDSFGYWHKKAFDEWEENLKFDINYSSQQLKDYEESGLLGRLITGKFWSEEGVPMLGQVIGQYVNTIFNSAILGEFGPAAPFIAGGVAGLEESYMEAQDTYSQVFNQLMSEGNHSPEDADKIASEAAQNTFYYNLPKAGLDAITAGIVLKPFKGASKLLNKLTSKVITPVADQVGDKFLGKVAKVASPWEPYIKMGVGSISEAAEENYQLAVQDYSYDKYINGEDENPFLGIGKNVLDNFSTVEGQTSMFLGMLGGIGGGYLGHLMGKQGQDAFIEHLKKYDVATNKYVQDLQLQKELAYKTGNIDEINRITDLQLAAITRNKFNQGLGVEDVMESIDKLAGQLSFKEGTFINENGEEVDIEGLKQDYANRVQNLKGVHDMVSKTFGHLSDDVQRELFFNGVQSVRLNKDLASVKRELQNNPLAQGTDAISQVNRLASDRDVLQDRLARLEQAMEDYRKASGGSTNITLEKERRSLVSQIEALNKSIIDIKTKNADFLRSNNINNIDDASALGNPHILVTEEYKKLKDRELSISNTIDRLSKKAADMVKTDTVDKRMSKLRNKAEKTSRKYKESLRLNDKAAKAQEAARKEAEAKAKKAEEERLKKEAEERERLRKEEEERKRKEEEEARLKDEAERKKAEAEKQRQEEEAKRQEEEKVKAEKQEQRKKQVNDSFEEMLRESVSSFPSIDEAADNIMAMMDDEEISLIDLDAIKQKITNEQKPAEPVQEELTPEPPPAPNIQPEAVTEPVQEVESEEEEEQESEVVQEAPDAGVIKLDSVGISLSNTGSGEKTILGPAYTNDVKVGDEVVLEVDYGYNGVITIPDGTKYEGKEAREQVFNSDGTIKNIDLVPIKITHVKTGKVIGYLPTRQDPTPGTTAKGRPEFAAIRKKFASGDKKVTTKIVRKKTDGTVATFFKEGLSKFKEAFKNTMPRIAIYDTTQGLLFDKDGAIEPSLIANKIAPSITKGASFVLLPLADGRYFAMNLPVKKSNKNFPIRRMSLAEAKNGIASGAIKLYEAYLNKDEDFMKRFLSTANITYAKGNVSEQVYKYLSTLIWLTAEKDLPSKSVTSLGVKYIGFTKDFTNGLRLFVKLSNDKPHVPFDPSNEVHRKAFMDQTIKVDRNNLESSPISFTIVYYDSVTGTVSSKTYDSYQNFIIESTIEDPGHKERNVMRVPIPFKTEKGNILFADPFINKDSLGQKGLMVNIDCTFAAMPEEQIEDWVDELFTIAVPVSSETSSPTMVKAEEEAVTISTAETQKADIEKRRQEELNKFPITLRLKKFNSEGENTELTDRQINSVEKAINQAIGQGKDAKEIIAILNALGFVPNAGNETTSLLNYIQDRIDGKEKSEYKDIHGKLIDRINTKYDAELAALNNQTTSEQQTQIEQQKAEIERRRQALKDLMEATGDDIFILGTQDGTFAGDGLLNMNDNGDVVLTRYADSEEGLTKGKGKTENLASIAGQFGGEQIATSGIEGGLQSFTNGVVGEYHIPLNELIQLIKDGYVVFAGLGNKEFVLSPHIADKYLTKVNGKEINAKYDAELAALKQPTVSDIEKSPNLKENVERFEKNVNNGWKMHLSISGVEPFESEDRSTPENEIRNRATQTIKILDDLKAKGIIKHYKVGQDGGQPGKNITVYIGNASKVESVVSAVEKSSELRSQNISDNLKLTDKISIRFDAEGKIEEGGAEFLRYGPSGIGLMIDVISGDVVKEMYNPKYLPDTIRGLRYYLGDYFDGSKLIKEKLAALEKEVTKEQEKPSDVPSLSDFLESGLGINLDFNIQATVEEIKKASNGEIECD